MNVLWERGGVTVPIRWILHLGMIAPKHSDTRFAQQSPFAFVLEPLFRHTCVYFATKCTKERCLRHLTIHGSVWGWKHRLNLHTSWKRSKQIHTIINYLLHIRCVSCIYTSRTWNAIIGYTQNMFIVKFKITVRKEAISYIGDRPPKQIPQGFEKQ